MVARALTMGEVRGSKHHSLLENTLNLGGAKLISREMRETIVTIREFLDGTVNGNEWDDFLSVPPRDPEVTKVQAFCRQLRADFRPESRVEYCNEIGRDRLRALLVELEAGKRV